jgi:queuine tRNA-ribosyltransferase
MKMTHRWLDRCVHQKVPVKYGYDQAFSIVQGSCYKDLRQQSAEYINSNQVGNAMGGLSVGEPAEEMYAMTEVVCEILPEDKPLFNGCRNSINILENIALG